MHEYKPMKQNTKPNVQSSNKSIRYSSDNHSSESDLKRQRLELKRRFGILQSRRTYLERELEAVQNLLISLDRQIKSHQAYEQLSIKRQRTRPIDFKPY